jgi:hypothetical protein
MLVNRATFTDLTKLTVTVGLGGAAAALSPLAVRRAMLTELATVATRVWRSPKLVAPTLSARSQSGSHVTFSISHSKTDSAGYRSASK